MAEVSLIKVKLDDNYSENESEYLAAKKETVLTDGWQISERSPKDEWFVVALRN